MEASKETLQKVFKILEKQGFFEKQKQGTVDFEQGFFEKLAQEITDEKRRSAEKQKLEAEEALTEPMDTGVVVQSNKLIEAHYRQQYTSHEQKMMLWVMTEIHKEDYFSKEYKHKTLTISAKEYAERVGIHPKDVYERAKAIGSNLARKIISIDTDEGWKVFHWIESMEYKNGEIQVLISPTIIPYIIDLKEQFTAFRLENVLYLNSTHAIKLYQILAQYKKIGERIITVDNLRSMLGVGDVKIYRYFGDIKRRILEISMREINKKTDLSVSFSEIKRSRKVVAVKFKITQKPNQEAQAKKEFERRLLQRLEGDSVKQLFQNHGFNQASVQAEFKKFLDEEIINYDPQSSRPIEIRKKEKATEEDNNKQRKDEVRAEQEQRSMREARSKPHISTENSKLLKKTIKDLGKRATEEDNNKQ
jgi:plasmid replication initiation protein